MDRAGEMRAWAAEVYDPNDPTRVDFTSEEAAHAAFRESARVIRETLGTWWLERELHERASRLEGMLGLERASSQDVEVASSPELILRAS
ncbi:MAG: hypothetical protein KKA97_06835 [Actinobacteria bacterium]|jgi:hypothetical protein|nr:hypothetical protein [Actinomycetota bacterium]